MTKQKSTPAIMGSLLKSGEWVTIKTIKKAIEESGKKVPTNMASRIYWLDRYLSKIGLTTEKRFDSEKEVVSLRMTETSAEDQLRTAKIVSIEPIDSEGGNRNNLMLETSYFWGSMRGNSREIVIVPRGAKPSNINNTPGSVRYHPHLYKRLAKLLKAAGVHPKAA